VKLTGSWWLVLVCCLVVVTPVWAGFDNRIEVSTWLTQNSDLGFEKSEVATFLAQTKAKPSIIPIISNAPERKWAWSQYGRRMVSDSRIKRGKQFVVENSAQLDLIAQATGVDSAIIAAIAGIESNYGANMGKHLTLRVLATLAFDYQRRSGFFQRQLAEFFRLCYSQGLDPTKVKGSSAGAVGMGQFIPTSYRDFAVDGDGDQRIDLFHSKADNIASIANFVSRHRWQAGAPWLLAVNADEVQTHWLSAKASNKGVALEEWQRRGLSLSSAAMLWPHQKFNLYAFSTAGEDEYLLGGANFYAITRYNHSLWYSRAVMDIAQAIAAP
jgi:membrane-bound lytic murein transglycosylase B